MDALLDRGLANPICGSALAPFNSSKSVPEKVCVSELTSNTSCRSRCANESPRLTLRTNPRLSSLLSTNASAAPYLPNRHSISTSPGESLISTKRGLYRAISLKCASNDSTQTRVSSAFLYIGTMTSSPRTGLEMGTWGPTCVPSVDLTGSAQALTSVGAAYRYNPPDSKSSLVRPSISERRLFGSMVTRNPASR